MFEKEAEEWVIDNVCKGCSRYEKCKSKEQCTCKECSKEKWQKGAEFGYNKANEWHYVKDGDLPLKTTLVLIKACGCFILGWLDDKDVWHNDSDNGARIPKDNIYAWKEIVLPELKESE